uniref:ATP synthase FO subunit 8 n=1 Tax=Microgaster campestris TaxID=1911504 RepID=A0A6F8AF12_9HYME|nr:ATP synthase FO subunit 8 [Microgaster campestris]
MPQMSSMDWIILMFYFLSLYMILLVNLYFMLKINLIIYSSFNMKFIYKNKW